MTDDTEKKALLFVGALLPLVPIVLMFVIGFPTLIFAGFLFSTLWNWWIAPTFGVMQLTVIQAMGIELVIKYFRTNYFENSPKMTLKSFLLGIVGDLFVVLMAWILLRFK